MAERNNFQDPLDPPYSPIEKLVTARRFRPKVRVADLLKHRGVDSDLADQIGSAIEEWDEEKDYHRQEEIRELESWANIHTHAGTPYDGAFIIGDVLSQEQSGGDMEFYAYSSGSFKNTLNLPIANFLTEDSNGCFYIASLNADDDVQITKYNDAGGIEWTTQLVDPAVPNFVHYPSGYEQIATSEDGSVVVYTVYEFIVCLDIEGNIVWSDQTVGENWSGCSVSPDMTKVAAYGREGTVRILDSSDGSVVNSTVLDNSNPPVHCCLTDTDIYLSHQQSSLISKRAISDLSLVWSVGIGAPSDRALYPQEVGEEGEELLWFFDSQTVHALDAATGAQVEDLSTEFSVIRTSFNGGYGSRTMRLKVLNNQVFLGGYTNQTGGSHEYGILRYDMTTRAMAWNNMIQGSGTTPMLTYLAVIHFAN